MRQLKQSTAVNVPVVMIDSSDHVSGKTGLALTIQMSKAGGAFSTITPTVTERSLGLYQIALTGSITDTLGDLVLHLSSAGADPQDVFFQVVLLDPYTAALDAPAVRAALGLASANVDTQLAAIAAYIDTEVAAIKSKTDQLTFTVANRVDAALTGNQGIKRNTAIANFPFKLTDSTNHAPLTGATVTAQRGIDGAGFGACANAVVEIGSGWYRIDLAAADLNGNTIALKFTATGADQVDIGIVTSP